MPESDSLLIACPQCGVELNIPPSANLAQLKCPQCQAFLEGATVKSIAPEQPSGPLPPHLQSSPETTEAMRPPEAPSGFKIDLDEKHSRGVRAGKRGLGTVGLILSALSLMLLTSLVVVSLIVRMLFPGLFTSQPSQDRTEVKVVQGSYSAPTKWVDASGKSLRVAGMRVKIERIVIGPILAKSGNQEILESQGENLLQVYLSLENESDEQVEYTSWYGNVFYVGEKEVVARLTNDKGEPYSMLVFEDTTGVFGHVPKAMVNPKEIVRDSIVFEIPAEETDIEGPWKLELPQAAIGLPGSLGFSLTKELLKTESVLGTSPLNGKGSDDEPKDDDAD